MSYLSFATQEYFFTTLRIFDELIFLPNIDVSLYCVRYSKLSTGSGVDVFQLDDLPNPFPTGFGKPKNT